MKFVAGTPKSAATAVAKQLDAELKAGKRVIWLVCGGSNIAAEVDIMTQLQKTSADTLANLLILPMDERYGSPGHADSNYKQMKDAGFEPGAALWVDVLSQDQPLAETINYYGAMTETAFASADYILGVFGLGTDGHTAGVLPHTPATATDAKAVVGYDSPPYTRLTLAPHLLIQTSAAYVLAYGPTKKVPLERLQHNNEPREALPSELFYDIADVYVYNDAITTEE